MGLLDDLDRRREQTSRHRENSGRLAQAYASWTSTGGGLLEYEERIDFGVIFTERPFISHACVVDTAALKELIGRVAMPHVTAYVTEWDTDEKDLYTGCWVAVRVDFALADMLDYYTQVVVDHDFTFTGVAIKDLGTDLV